MNEDILQDISSAVGGKAEDIYQDKKKGEYIKAWIIGGSIAGVLALGFYAIYRFSE